MSLQAFYYCTNSVTLPQANSLSKQTWILQKTHVTSGAIFWMICQYKMSWRLSVSCIYSSCLHPALSLSLSAPLSLSTLSISHPPPSPLSLLPSLIFSLKKESKSTKAKGESVQERGNKQDSAATLLNSAIIFLIPIPLIPSTPSPQAQPPPYLQNGHSSLYLVVGSFLLHLPKDDMNSWMDKGG